MRGTGRNDFDHPCMCDDLMCTHQDDPGNPGNVCPNEATHVVFGSADEPSDGTDMCEECAKNTVESLEDMNMEAL